MMIVKVKSIEPDGAIVTIFNGPRRGEDAWLPSKEWSSDPSGWDDAYDVLEVNQELDVVELPGKAEHKGAIVVSRRLFSEEYVDETWNHRTRVMEVDIVSQNLILGHIGSVKAIMNRAAYLDFLMSKKANPALDQHAVLAKGDMIGGIVMDTPRVSSGTELDPARYLELLEQDSTLSSKQQVSDIYADVNNGNNLSHTASVEMVEQANPVLLVENDNSVCNSIQSFLSQLGFHVMVAHSSEEAGNIISNRKQGAIGLGEPFFGMAIVDPNLDAANTDLSGMPIIQGLQLISGCRIILITGQIDDNRMLEKWGHLCVHVFLRKPFTQWGLLEAMDEAMVLEGRTLRELLEIGTNDAQLALEAFEEQNAALQISEQVEEPSIAIKKALGRLVSTKSGTIAHVFMLYPRSFRIQSVANAGGYLDWRPLRGKLWKSRIKDAALSDEPILENVSENRRAHLWTLEMMQYESFCGVPIEMLDGNYYALTSFHKNPDVFDKEYCLNAMLCAERIARSLERQRFLGKYQNEVTPDLRNTLLRSLTHQLYNDLIAVEGNAFLLDNFLHGDILPSESSREKAKRRNSVIRTNIEEAMRVTRLIRGVSGGRQLREESVSVQNCLYLAAIACSNRLPLEVKESSNISIAIPPAKDENEWYIKTVPLTLIEVFYNLYLNSVQQLELMRQIRRRGRIWHSLDRRRDRNGDFWIFVQIHDTGPGIHRKDWERIFNPGFTTKQKGEGQGLYLCQTLLSSIHESGRHASIRVTRSVLWDGTTITVKLPHAISS